MSTVFKLKAPGRGRKYTPLRGLAEGLMRLAYAGDWPARLWAAVPGRTNVHIARHRLSVMPRGHAPVRLAFISDIHIGPTTPRSLIDGAFAHLRDANPDILLLGGDYVFLEVTEGKARALGDWVDSVPAPVKLAVLGNHDLWDHHTLLEAELTARGVEVLVNRHVPIPGCELAVVGLDDPYTGSPDADKAFAGVNPDHPVVVLCHAPEGLDYIEGRQAKVMVCGHTHGGQIATPWGPVVVPGPRSRKFCAGLYQWGNTHVFVSRGVGTVEVAPRLYAPPDIAILDLVAIDSPPNG